MIRINVFCVSFSSALPLATAVVIEPTESSSMESYLLNADPLNTLNALRFLQKEVLQKGKGQVSSTDLHRLYKAYPILLDRIFGEVEIVGSRKMESNGGWLAYNTRLVVVVVRFPSFRFRLVET